MCSLDTSELLEHLAISELRYMFPRRWKRRHDGSEASIRIRTHEVKKMHALIAAIRYLRHPV